MKNLYFDYTVTPVISMLTSNQWHHKWVISIFITLQQIKEVTANGFEKLNMLMIAQSPLPAKKY